MYCYARGQVIEILARWRKDFGSPFGPVMEALVSLSGNINTSAGGRWRGLMIPQMGEACGIVCPVALAFGCEGLDCGRPGCPFDAGGEFPLMAVFAYGGPGTDGSGPDSARTRLGHTLVLGQRPDPPHPYLKLVVHFSELGVSYGCCPFRHPLWDEMGYAQGTFAGHAWTHLMDGGPSAENGDRAGQAAADHLVPHLLAGRR